MRVLATLAYDPGASAALAEKVGCLAFQPESLGCILAAGPRSDAQCAKSISPTGKVTDELSRRRRNSGSDPFPIARRCCRTLRAVGRTVHRRTVGSRAA